MKVAICLVSAVLIAVAPVRAEEDFSAELMKEIDGLKCQPGFVKFPSLLMKAISVCALQGLTIASFPCFKTCVLRDMNIADNFANGTVDIDYGAIDSIAMDAYDMSDKAGRTSYFRIANNAHECGRTFTSNPENKFATTYGDAPACVAGDTFFKCCTSILTCPETPAAA